MVQHHCSCPDLGNGISYRLTSDIGRGAVHRLEHRWKLASWVQVGGRGQTHAANYSGAQIGKNVAKKVRTHDDIEPVWMLNKMRRKDVDMELVCLDVGILFSHSGEPFIPIGHCVNNTV